MSAKIVLQKRKRDSVSECLKLLHWLPVLYRIKFKFCLSIHKFIHGEAPQYLKNLLKPKGNISGLRSNSTNTLEITYTNIKISLQKLFDCWTKGMECSSEINNEY